MATFERIVQALEAEDTGRLMAELRSYADKAVGLLVRGDRAAAVQLAAHAASARELLIGRDEPLALRATGYLLAVDDQLAVGQQLIAARQDHQQAQREMGPASVLSDQLLKALSKMDVPQRPKAIAAEVGRDRGHVSRAIGRLVKDGLVTEASAPAGNTDKRGLWYELTPAGRKAAPAAKKPTKTAKARKATAQTKRAGTTKGKVATNAQNGKYVTATTGKMTPKTKVYAARGKATAASQRGSTTKTGTRKSSSNRKLAA